MNFSIFRIDVIWFLFNTRSEPKNSSFSLELLTILIYTCLLPTTLDIQLNRWIPNIVVSLNFS